MTFVISGGINVYHGVNLPCISRWSMAVVDRADGRARRVPRPHAVGMAIRAVAQDLDAARLMGVPVGKLYPLTMGLASARWPKAFYVFLGGLYFASPQVG